MDNLVIEDYIQTWGEEHRYLATSYRTTPPSSSLSLPSSLNNTALVAIEYMKHTKGFLLFTFYFFVLISFFPF